MRALTIHQPWTWAIVAGLKPVEIRTWYNPYRGIVLIHAGREESFDKEARFTYRADKVRVFSAVIGYAYLESIKKYESAGDFNSDHDLHLNPYTTPDTWADAQAESPGMQFYGWVFRHPWQLPDPVPCKGRQMLWNPPEHIVAAVREQRRPTDEF